MIFKTSENKDNLSGLNFGTATQIKKKAQLSIADDLKKDVKALTEYQDGIQTAEDKTAFFNTTMGKSSKSAQEYAAKIKNSEGTAEAYAASQKAAAVATEGVGVASKAAAIGVGLLKTALNMGIMIAVSYGIEKLVEYISSIKSASEQAKEELDTATKDLTDVTSKVNDINTKLEDTNKQIDALKSKGALTFVDQSQLTTLQKTSLELQTQLETAEALKKLDEEKQTKAAIKSFNTQNSEKIDPFNGAVNTDNNLPSSSGMSGIQDALSFYTARLQQVNKNQKEYNELLSKGNNLTDEEKQKKETLAYLNKDDDSVTLKENLLNRAKAYSDLANTIDASYSIEAKSAKQSALEQANAILKVVDAEQYAKNQTDKFNTVSKDSKYETQIKALSDLAKQGKLTADTLNSEKYTDLVAAFGDVGISSKDIVTQLNALSGSNADKKINDIKDSSEALSKTMSNLTDNLSILKTAQQEYKDSGNLTFETLQKLVDKYPALEQAVAEYQAGLMSTSQLMGVINKQYTSDVDNYKKAVFAKLSYNDQLYNNTILKNSKYVKSFNDMYKVDLSNYKNLAEAKSAIETQLLTSVIKNWAQFYNAQSNTYTDDFAKLGMSAGQGNKESIAKVSAMEEAVGKYKTAVDSLNKISLNGVNLNTVNSNLTATGKKDTSAKKEASEAESAAKKAAEALKNQYDLKLKTIDADKEEGKYDKDRMSYYRALIALQKEYANSKLDADDKEELRKKVASALKDYEQGTLDLSYKELDNRKALGVVQENSKAELQNLLEIQKNLNSSAMSLVNTDENRLALQEKIYTVQKAMLDNQNQKLKDAETAAEAIIDAQIKNLQKQEESLTNRYQPQIDAYQNQIDALQKVNDEHAKELALEKAQVAWESAQNQKSISIYRNGQGFVYEADQSAITSAGENLANAKLDKQVDDLTQKKNALQKTFDDQKKSLEDSIKSWENYKEQWSDVLADYQLQQQTLLLSETLGASSEKDILSQRLDVLSTFKDKYIAIQKEMADYANKATTSATRNTSSIASDNTYLVKKGDTLSGIADYFGIALSKLKSANGNITSVTVGKKVKIPSYSTGINKVPYNQIANVDEGSGQELIIRKPDQGRLTSLEMGDGVLNAGLTDNMFALANNAQTILANTVQPNLSLVIPNKNSSQGSTNQYHIDKIELPNVTDAHSFFEGLKRLPLDAEQALFKNK